MRGSEVLGRESEPCKSNGGGRRVAPSNTGRDRGSGEYLQYSCLEGRDSPTIHTEQ